MVTGRREEIMEATVRDLDGERSEDRGKLSFVSRTVVGLCACCTPVWSWLTGLDYLFDLE